MPVLTTQNPFPSSPKKETMNKSHASILCTILVAGLSAATFAQAPIERQAPPPPDQQQAQPLNQQPGQPAYPQSGQPQYQQQAPPPDQQQGPPPPPVPPQQLDQLVQRIALYPDPLLAQVLTAATFWNQIPDAASWAELHNYLTGDALAQAIQPVNPAFYYVPVYNPGVVFYAPRPGFVISGAIRFGPVVTIGPAFGHFGWYGAGFGWGGHAILIDHRPWIRTYANRGVYVHPYAHPYVRSEGPRVESYSHEHGNDHHR
jgi:hypothetical protein